jgi:hypothetical protein
VDGQRSAYLSLPETRCGKPLGNGQQSMKRSQRRAHRRIVGITIMLLSVAVLASPPRSRVPACVSAASGDQVSAVRPQASAIGKFDPPLRVSPRYLASERCEYPRSGYLAPLGLPSLLRLHDAGNTLWDAALAGPPAPVGVGNEHLFLGLDLGNGITVTSLRDRVTGHELLGQFTSLFEFAVNNGTPYQSDHGLEVTRFWSAEDGSTLYVDAEATNVPLAFRFRLRAAPGEPAVAIDAVITNTGPSPIFLRTVYPKVHNFVTPGDPAQMMGMVPQEIGTVVPLLAVSPGAPLGMPFNIGIGLPTSMNTMEVASIYDGAGGGGLFFASVGGDLTGAHGAPLSPLQFNLSAGKVAGFWIANIAAGQQVSLPQLAVGVQHGGDWHSAVDYYVAKNRPYWSFPPVPAWFRDQGAIYGFSGGGAGGIFLEQPGLGLKERIHSFLNLPQLLSEAQDLGTNIVYLWDYWEGAKQGGDLPYWNKGDYIPRADMGGERDFIEGIRQIHQRGGRVIVYVEPFIIYQESNIAQMKGLLWAARDPSSGQPYQHYPRNYTMVAPFRPWQDYLVSVCQRLVRDDGVDGIFLDSYGWQMNWPMTTVAEGRLYSPLEYCRGVLELTDRVRSTIQGIKPDAVVLGETTSGPMSQHWHGGLSADFTDLINHERSINQGRIIASPVRCGMPEVNYISNGIDLNGLHQIYAAGHSLALCNNGADSPPNFMRDHREEIRKLVRIRQERKDALIYGRQTYQPATGSPDVAAYFYEGTQNQILTVVNTSSSAPYSGSLLLRDRGATTSTTWVDLLTDQLFTTGSIASGGQVPLPLTVAAGGLRVLAGRMR